MVSCLTPRSRNYAPRHSKTALSYKRHRFVHVKQPLGKTLLQANLKSPGTIQTPGLIKVENQNKLERLCGGMPFIFNVLALARTPVNGVDVSFVCSWIWSNVTIKCMLFEPALHAHASPVTSMLLLCSLCWGMPACVPVLLTLAASRPDGLLPVSPFAKVCAPP